ncbi:MAG: hypothetical protein HN576_13895 [Bacteriovoracaceae bacterium]|nr:hypothetical protein [Bacteriovoracaceae bacterium]
MVLIHNLTFNIIKGLLLCTLLASISACNKAEFFQKEFLKGIGVDNDGDVPTSVDIPLDSPEHPNNYDKENPTHRHDEDQAHDIDCPFDKEEWTSPSFTMKTEVFTQTSKTYSKVDILWVIDDSGSMKDEQASMSYNFDAFIQEFILKDIDFRMAITTTDPSKKIDGKMVCDWHVLNSEHAAVNKQNFFHMFEKCIKVGTKGSGREKGLNATDRFLHHYEDKNIENKFLRKDAYFIVVIVSDEEDQSRKSVNNYIERLKSIKDHEGMVKVYSIVNVEETSAKWESKGSRYIDLSLGTNGVIADINNDFYQTLSDFGNEIVYLLKSFSLASTPVNNEITVLINNIETSDYRYDEKSKNIIFNEKSIPSAGSEISITYLVQK